MAGGRPSPQHREDDRKCRGLCLGPVVGAAIIKLQLNVAKWKLDPILPELLIFPENLGIDIYIFKNIESSNF